MFLKNFSDSIFTIVYVLFSIQLHCLTGPDFIEMPTTAGCLLRASLVCRELIFVGVTHLGARVNPEYPFDDLSYLEYLCSKA